MLCMFQKLCEGEDHQTLLLHTEVRWLSKGNFLVHLAELWDMFLSLFTELWDVVLIFVYHMETNAHNKKQKRKAETLFSALNNSNTKARIFYLADLFEYVNQLNNTTRAKH